MFKKKTTKSTVTQKKVQNSELTEVIEKLQQHADQVEKNIIDTEAKLQKDVNNKMAGRAQQYHDDTSKRIGNSEDLLKGLGLDAASARRLGHPQADMIEEDIKQLKDRVRKLRLEHERVYSLSRSESLPNINWGKIIEEKQMNLNNKGFGNDLPMVDNQVDEHNIFHSEVEAIRPHITQQGDQEYINDLQVKYNKLLNNSQMRQRDLNSLRDYMQRCTNELYWMDQQGQERINYDWSDKNLDYQTRQKQYENFINRSLEAKEASITKLHEDGEKLLAANHPGTNAIEAHTEAVHADWKEYLNLLICEEKHLKYMDDYHKYHKDAKDTQDLLKKLETDLSQKYNPEFKDIYQTQALIEDLDDQAKALDQYDETVKALQKRSQQVVPLKYRRETPLKPVPVEALCEYDSEEGQIARGERYTLLKNSGVKWDVADAAGRKKSAPAVCFMIPPTDPEALAIADNLATQHKSIKKKNASTKAALMKRYEELKKENTGGSVSTADKQEQQCRQLMSGLDKVYSDLDKQEKGIYSCLRPPLDQSHPVQDSAERLQDLKMIESAVRRVEPEKTLKVRDAQAFLATSPRCASVPQLYSKVDETVNKYDKVDLLLRSAEDKFEASNRLENTLHKGKNMLSTYENKLAREEIAPSDLRSLENTQQELSEMSRELKSQRSTITEAEQNLQSAKANCDNLASKLQEHCPDIDRQEAEVRKMNKRYDNLNKQINSRSQDLQTAKTAYANYRSEYDSLNSWLTRVPNYEPKETDNIRQIETKLANQRSLLTDISRKESELENVSRNSLLYQEAVKNYELEAEKFKSILDLEDGVTTQTYKKHKLESPAVKVKNEESALGARFTEVNAVNKQRLQNLEFAQSLVNQQPEVSVVQQNSVQTQMAQAPGEQPWRIKKQLEDEVQRRQQLENEVKNTQGEIYLLEGQRPQDTVVKKEVIKKVPDPQLDDEFYKYQQRVSEEQRLTRALENELEALRLKLRGFETEKREGAQQYVVKEVLRIEKDRVQEDEVQRLREELEEIRRQKTVKENELTLIRKRITIVSEEKNKEQEIVTEKELVKIQNDPQLESEYRMLIDNKQKEMESRKRLEEELQLLQDKLKRLEKEKAMAEEKIMIKEVLKVEKDLALEREVEQLRHQYDAEKAKSMSTQREQSELLRKITVLEEAKSKTVTQEKMREIVRPDPKAESELGALRFELVEQQRRSRDAELQLKTLHDELTMLRNRGPQIEYKEMIKEVIKYKTDPETERELEKLRNEIVDKTRQTERSELEVAQLREEIQRWKETKPQVTVKEVVNEVVQYREDPKTRQEVESLKIKLAEEQRMRMELERERSANEEKIKLKKIALSEVREKFVQQEVVKMEEDPILKLECTTFSQNINNEQKQKEVLRNELYILQRRKTELEQQLEDLERERKARREAELEIQRLRVQLNELEIREKQTREKVTVQQKVVLQQDPQQEKEYSLLKLEVEEEKHKRLLLEKELQTLIEKQRTLEKMEVREKVVFSEKVQVEKDPEVEWEIERLKTSLEEESKRRRELDVELSRLNSKLSEAEFTNAKYSKELDYIREENLKLQQEKLRLQNEARRFQSDIQITAKETKEITASSSLDNGKNLELRLMSLQKELAELKNIALEKDQEIEKLNKSLSTIRTKREQRESHLRRSIVVIDPDTGREMTPEEAHREGLIDWKMFVNLQSQECDWEEISLKGPNGESTVLHDRKSGKKFSIEDALQNRVITKDQLRRYQNKELSIQEFGLMVSGRAK
ncbi:periplakin-like [Polyodon spathula]|uniref:periplakin-like n=1 Tax=Polyodon spathula TaxID=7913 RepID=UPI001B7EEAB2|nr:periplakin-like [Polyodon spathula]